MNDDKKIKVAAVVGPTASGKTRLEISLAKALGGEVISADSMQIYKGMDIATAKPTASEMSGVPHRLISVIPPGESFSAARYTELASAAVRDVSESGKLPIIVGGTGLYVDSLLNNIEFVESEIDVRLRSELNEKAKKYGAHALWEELYEIDRESAERIEPNNVKRVARAIEIFRTTGLTMTEQNRRSRLNGSPYTAVKIGLKTSDRSVLYDRINRRVDEMVANGLTDEARGVFESGSMGDTAKMAIGIKELAPYFKGEQTLEEALDTIKLKTRRYAKRQLTWFMRDKDIHWFNTDEYQSFSEIEEEAARLVEKVLHYSV